MNNVIHKQYKILTTSFYENLSNTSARFGTEDIHQLRVDVKKLRALIRLIEFISEGKIKADDHFAVFFELFKVSGKLREIQINMSLINIQDQNIISPYNDYLREQKQKLIPKLQRRLVSFKRDELEKLNELFYKDLAKMSDETILEFIGLYSIVKISEIKRLRKSPTDSNLHKIRFNAKEIKEYLKIQNSISSTKRSLKLEDEIKNFNEMIGSWHDMVVLVSSVVKFINRCADGENKQQMILLTEKIRIMNHIDKDHIISELDKLLFKYRL